MEKGKKKNNKKKEEIMDAALVKCLLLLIKPTFKKGFELSQMRDPN